MEERISISAHVLGGKPYITGTKLTVTFVLEMLKAGYTFDRILESYPQIERQDIQACLSYAIGLIERGSGREGQEEEKGIS